MIFPTDWNTPPAIIQELVKEASEKFEIPAEILLSIMRKESNFRQKLRGSKNATNSEIFKKSYERYKDARIPGPNPKGLTWGDMFKAEDWTAYGLCQLLPFNIVGKTGGPKAGASLLELYNPVSQVRLAAALLRAYYDKTGTWESALLRYNGSKAYVKMVTAFVEALKEAQKVA